MSKFKQFFARVGGWFKKVGVSIGRWFKSLFVSVGNEEPKFRKLARTDGFTSVCSSLVSILIGIAFGAVLLFCLRPEFALSGIVSMLTAGLVNPVNFAEVLYSSTPLILTGLSVGFAFKTGLFNIGAPGQYLVGTFLALYGAIVLQMPWWVCLLLAIVGGVIWGAIPGIFKALLNVNEVITSIMFNWIGLFMVNLLYSNIPAMLSKLASGALDASRTISLGLANPNAILPKWGLDVLFGSNYMNIGFLIAIIIAIIFYVVLNKTTFGYELKACGFNKNGAKYAGINEKKSIILSMVIAGGLAGLGGGMYYLSGVAEYTIVKTLPAMGFNGIPVALLASSNPIGIIFSALFVSYIKVGGNAMQPEFAKEVIDIIIAVIIYLSAFALLFRNGISKRIKGRIERNVQREADKAQKAQNPQVGDSGIGILPDDSDENKEE